MINNNQIKLIVVSFVTITLSGYLFWSGLKPVFKTPTPQSQIVRQNNIPKQILGDASESGKKQNQVKVLKVVDGDTIEVELDGQQKKIRYIGVNTPETVDPRRSVQCFGKEASDENKRLLEGKFVILEKDVSETDKFGRLLRFVYLKLDDGMELFINDYLVREGFAKVNTYPPDVKYQQRFLAAQKEARENNRGLWAKCR